MTKKSRFQPRFAALSNKHFNPNPAMTIASMIKTQEKVLSRCETFFRTGIFETTAEGTIPKTRASGGIAATATATKLRLRSKRVKPANADRQPRRIRKLAD